MTVNRERRNADAQAQEAAHARHAGAVRQQDRLVERDAPVAAQATGASVVAPSNDHGFRPKLRSSIDPRLTADGRVFLLRGAEHDDMQLEGQGHLVAALLRKLNGQRSVPQIASDLRAEGHDVDDRLLGEALDELVAGQIVDDVGQAIRTLDRYDYERYGRQLACFADMLGDGGLALGAQMRLAQSTVCLLGLGGLGTWAALALASAGVGRIVGVDQDRVELSNLNRQILYAESDIGSSKARLAGQALTRFNPRLRYEAVQRTVDSAAAVQDLVAGCDLVIDSLDTPSHKITQWVNEGCSAANVAHLAMSQHPPLLRVGPLYVPGTTGCFACQEAAYRKDYELYEALEGSEQLATPSATFGPACAIVGALVASEAVSWLAGVAAPPSLGAALMIDLRDMEIHREPVTALAGCPVCS